jgi:CheY-like chemotaxis protein
MNTDPIGQFTVLMAEDDPDDRFLIEQAFLEVQSRGDLRFVEDGEELISYLVRSGKYADPTLSPRPTLVLLDLNMPKKDGREALVEIKKDPDLREIPVVVWTTSNEIEDKIECQKAGASKYVTKPMDFAGLVGAVKELVAQYSPESAVV